ncbi:MAG TPA: hypothetical protein PKD98_19875 [Anaerolineae bacterium]|nr:hypothetical protein [Anaerolineae bacterium]
MSSSDLIQATRPLIQLLEQRAIRYYIGGSVASSAHGLPRTTIDVDIVVELKHTHVETIVKALQDSFYIDADMIHAAIDNETSFNIVHLETFIKLDIFILKSNAYDQMIIQRAIEGTLAPDDTDELIVRFSSPEDIVLHKLHWFRLGGQQSERQWGDVIGVLKVQLDKLDRDYMHQWARQLGVDDLLNRALDQTSSPLEK